MEERQPGELVNSAAQALEMAMGNGDLTKLTPDERLQYYRATCESLGLNPLTNPFKYIILNGKTTLYATRDCTDQLRKINGVSVSVQSRTTVDGVHIVTMRAESGGRIDESIGAVSINGLKGEALANAYMKAETKAKRRATLSICGLGWLDETEVTTIPGARIVDDEPTSEELPKGLADELLTEQASAAEAKKKERNDAIKQRFAELSMENTARHVFLEECIDAGTVPSAKVATWTDEQYAAFLDALDARADDIEGENDDDDD